MRDRPILSAARRVMRSLAARLAKRPEPVAVPPARDARPGPGPGPMRPLRPPAAVNDNPLTALTTEVERDLRSRGYLR